MRQYKLTEPEMRDLANRIATAFHQVHPNIDYNKWISDYMETYNKVMNVIASYNQNIDGETTN